jgi:hypothetical protein
MVLGQGEEGLAAATFLVRQPLPPVKPQAGFESGDVLRALRSGRDLVAESLRFSNEPAYQALLSLRAEEGTDTDETDEGSDANGNIDDSFVSASLLTNCIQTLDLWQRSGALHRFITPRLIVSDHGLLVEVPPRNSKSSSKSVKLPWNASTEILDLQTKVAALAELLLEVPDLSSRLLTHWKAWRLLQQSNMTDEHQWHMRLCSSLCDWGFLRRDRKGYFVLTAKGLVAAGIRATEAPHVFVEACLAGSELTTSEARELASLLCGSGKEPAAEVPLLRSRVPAGMLQTLNVSEARLQAAVVLWAEGKRLSELQVEAATPPGTFSKHVVRCCDLLLEAAGALQSFAPGVAETLQEARMPLVRGLPFLQLLDVS